MRPTTVELLRDILREADFLDAQARKNNREAYLGSRREQSGGSGGATAANHLNRGTTIVVRGTSTCHTPFSMISPMKTAHAIIEKGMFRPLEVVELPEQCEVEFEPRPGLVVIVDGVFRGILAGKLRRGQMAPFLVLLFSGAAAQKNINVMQRLCLEVFRQMLRFFRKHFGDAHVPHYDDSQTGLNQVRMRHSEAAGRIVTLLLW